MRTKAPPRTGADGTENAVETLRSLKSQWENDTNRQSEALTDIQQALGLPDAPNRIECYDISNTQGTYSVGSMVVFEQGVPKKSLYRRFNIQSVSGPDDFASMEEVLTTGPLSALYLRAGRTRPGAKPDASFSFLPDLLIVDGGKGQLGRAVKVLESFNLMAKYRSSAWPTGRRAVPARRSQSILLPRHSHGLYLSNASATKRIALALPPIRNRRSKAGWPLT